LPSRLRFSGEGTTRGIRWFPPICRSGAGRSPARRHRRTVERGAPQLRRGPPDRLVGAGLLQHRHRQRIADDPHRAVLGQIGIDRGLGHFAARPTDHAGQQRGQHDHHERRPDQ